MPALRPEVELKGTKIEAGLLNNLPINWKTRVDYTVNLPEAYARRSRGFEKGDGFNLTTQTYTGPVGYQVDWENKFGGGVLDITAETNIKGIPVSDTYIGKVEGETFNDTFKNQITAYLEKPDADLTAPTVQSEVGYGKFFRVIAYIETRYRHFYPSIYGIPKGSIYPRENESDGDGGFGVMQLTDPVPTYEQIWNYKKNIDGGVELIRSKLEEAKAYPEFVRTNGCTTPSQGNTYFCKPIQKKNKDATDFSAYELRMDTYSLYNSGWHYWKWLVLDVKRGIKGWQPRREKGKAAKKTGSYYADEAEKIENNPPSDF